MGNRRSDEQPGGGILNLGALRRAISRWLAEQTDLLPPYHIYQGSEWEKRAEAGRHHLVIGSVEVEIDGVTASLLEPGETIRVRYTRGLRALNLDRFTGDPPPPP